MGRSDGFYCSTDLLIKPSLHPQHALWYHSQHLESSHKPTHTSMNASIKQGALQCCRELLAVPRKSACVWERERIIEAAKQSELSHGYIDCSINSEKCETGAACWLRGNQTGWQRQDTQKTQRQTEAHGARQDGMVAGMMERWVGINWGKIRG